MNVWRESQIGEEIELAYGKSLPAHAREAGTFQVYDSNGWVGSHSKPLVIGPGIVVGRKGSVGKVSYSTEDFWPIDTTYYVVNKKGHDWRFLYHLLSSAGLDGLNSHSAIPGLNREIAYAVPISLPDKVEQAQIAFVLDRVESATNQERVAIEQTQALKRATMRALFTHGLRGKAQKETEIGPVPENWEQTTLGDLCKGPGGAIQTGPFGSQLHKDDYQETGVPVINPTHLDAGRINHENVPRVSGENANRLDRHRLCAGDIVFARRGQIGRMARVTESEEGWLCGTGSFLVRARQPFVDNRFLHFQLSTEPVAGWLTAHAAGAIMPNLNNVVLRRIPVFLPSVDEQSEIVATLDGIDLKIDLHRRKRAVLEELFKALLQKLMTGEIRATELNISTV
ncbi:MAG: restriction endonuclease subunit S [Gammaproteobacteria bacterium]|nr:restriction endonuclease subunit S [Gammaproteobacteria bacterium]